MHKTLLLLICSYVVLTIVFSGLMVAVYMIPCSMMEQQLKESVSKMASHGESYYYMLPQRESMKLDDYSTALMLNEAGHGDSDPLTNAFLNPHGSGGKTQADMLSSTIGDYDPDHYSMYPRYWHGYLVVLKPLLLVFNLAQIRVLWAVSFNLILLLLVALLARREGIGVAIGFAMTYVIVNYMTAIYSLPLSFTFWVSLLASAYILVKTRKGTRLIGQEGSTPFWIVRFFIIGAITTFLDMLYAPLVALGIPLALLVTLSRKHIEYRSIPSIACICASWFAGFALLWVTKWLLATIITGIDVFADAYSQASVRVGTGRNERTPQGTITRLGAIVKNVHVMSGQFYLGFVPAVVAALATLVCRMKGRGVTNASHAWILVLVFIALMPFVWFVGLANHSYQHAFFAYRTLAVVFACLYLWAGAIFDDAVRTTSAQT